MSEYAFFEMRKVEKKQVAKVGRFKFYETDYILERAMTGENDLLQVEYANLLPSGDNLISLREASARSGLSVTKLTKLCEHRTIVAKKISRKWMIDVQSLKNYLQK